MCGGFQRLASGYHVCVIKHRQRRQSGDQATTTYISPSECAHPKVVREEAREGRVAPWALCCLILEILACSGVHAMASG